MKPRTSIMDWVEFVEEQEAKELREKKAKAKAYRLKYKLKKEKEEHDKIRKHDK